MSDDMNFDQRGFVNGKSTLINILESIDINKYLMKMGNADITYFDFSKASHYHLLVKMKNLSLSK